MPSTWDLVDQARRLMAVIEEDAGVLTEETEAALAAWVNASEDKIGACVMAARRFDTEAQLLKEEEERLYRRRKALDAARERCRGYAQFMLEELEQMGNEPKVKGPNYTAYLQTADSLTYPDDIAQWPLNWRKTVVSPDKQAASDAMRSGAEMPPGFEVVQKRSLRFR